MVLDQLRHAKYISLETFRKNGQGVKTPVWQAAEENKLYVWTAADSWKVKRIRHNQQVKVCQSDWRGKPLSDWVKAQARLVDSPEEKKRQQQRMAAKYGWQFWLFYLLNKLSRTDHVVIEIR